MWYHKKKSDQGNPMELPLLDKSYRGRSLSEKKQRLADEDSQSSNRRDAGIKDSAKGSANSSAQTYIAPDSLHRIFTRLPVRSARSITDSPLKKLKDLMAKTGQYDDGSLINLSMVSLGGYRKVESDLHLEDMSAKAMRRLEFVFKLTEEKVGPLDYEGFKVVLTSVLGKRVAEREMKMMFMKIDTNCDESVSWSEYISFILCELQKKDIMRSSKNDNPLPDEITKTLSTKHHSFITRIRYTPNLLNRGTVNEKWDYNNGHYVTLSMDGTICFWRTNLDCIRTTQIESSRTAPTYASDVVVMPNVNLLAVSTSDSDIRFYEMNSAGKLERVMTLFHLPDMCLTLDYWFDHRDMNKGKLFWGDCGGSVFVLHFYKCLSGGPFGLVSQYRRVSFKQLQLDIKTGFRTRYTLQKFKKLHKDWIRSVKYLPGLESFVSSCCEMTTAMALTSLSDLTSKYFNVTKGVICFDYSARQNILVSGGIEQNIRGWNPFINAGPIFRLKGSSAVLNLLINQERDLCISINVEKNVSIYSLKDQALVQTIPPRSFPKHVGKKPLTSAYFNNRSQILIVGGMDLSVFIPDLEKEQSLRASTHESSPAKVLFNDLYDVVASASVTSIICIWDIRTGEKKLMFDKAHSTLMYNREMIIDLTAMTFDHTNRRLITGGRDGTVKIWNFHNGDCLRTLNTMDNMEVTQIVSLQYKILCCGLNRRVTAFMDVADADNLVKVWEKKHDEDILCMCYHYPNVLVTASYDGDLLVWSTETNNPACRLNVHESDKPILGGERPRKLESQRSLITRRFNLARRLTNPTAMADPGKLHFMDMMKARLAAAAAEIEEEKAKDERRTVMKDQMSDESPGSKTPEPMPVYIPKKPAAVIGGGSQETLTTTTVTSLPNSAKLSSIYSPFRCPFCLGIKRFTSRARIVTHDYQLCSCDDGSLPSSRSQSISSTRRSTNTKMMRGPQSAITSTCVSCIVALGERKIDRKTAVILAAGVDGWVRAWSIHYKGGLIGQFRGVHKYQDSVTCMTVDKKNHYLFTADASGYIKVWYIGDYCTKYPYTESLSPEDKNKFLDERYKTFNYYSFQKCYKRFNQSQSQAGKDTINPPPLSSNPDRTCHSPILVCSYRGHIKGITCIMYADRYKLLVTGAEDHNVRVWTLSGRFLGQLGTHKWPKLLEEDDAWLTDYDFQLPRDILRVATPRTFRVLNGGTSKRWKYVKTGIMLLVGSWFKFGPSIGAATAPSVNSISPSSSVAAVSEAGGYYDVAKIHLPHKQPKTEKSMESQQKYLDSLKIPEMPKPVDCGRSKVLGKFYKAQGCHKASPAFSNFISMDQSIQVWPKVVTTDINLDTEEPATPNMLVQRANRKKIYAKQILELARITGDETPLESTTNEIKETPSASPKRRETTPTRKPQPEQKTLASRRKEYLKTSYEAKKKRQYKPNQKKNMRVETVDKLSLEIAEILGEENNHGEDDELLKTRRLRFNSLA